MSTCFRKVDVGASKPVVQSFSLRTELTSTTETSEKVVDGVISGRAICFSPHFFILEIFFDVGMAISTDE